MIARMCFKPSDCYRENGTLCEGVTAVAIVMVGAV